MKSVELKLLIEGVGAYTFEGEVEDIFGEVSWKKHGGNIDICDGLIHTSDENVSRMEKELLRFADEFYPHREISTIINYRKTN